MNTQSNFSADILEEAQIWHARLSDDQMGQNIWIDFTVWLEQSSSHADAYDAVELAMFEISAPSAVENVEHAAELQADHATILPFSKPKKKRLFYREIAAIAAVLMVGLMVMSQIDIFAPQVETVQYATNIGGQRDVVLSDGTRVTLNTNTQLSVVMDKKSRRVNLESGEAFFEIAKDQERPFLVMAMGTQITDIGTSFNVYATENRLQVSVVEGIVELSASTEKVRLTKGMTGTQFRGKPSFHVASVDIDIISTWRNGVLVYEDIPLSTLIPEINRYFETPIVIEDSNISALTFSGALNIRDEHKMLRSLAALLPIKTEEKNDQILISSQR